MSNNAESPTDVRCSALVSWRRGMDSTAHAILGCDPMASAWVAVCGVLITGKQSLPNDFKCPVCVRDSKPANA